MSFTPLLHEPHYVLADLDRVVDHKLTARERSTGANGPKPKASKVAGAQLTKKSEQGVAPTPSPPKPQTDGQSQSSTMRDSLLGRFARGLSLPLPASGH